MRSLWYLPVSHVHVSDINFYSDVARRSRFKIAVQHSG